MSFLMFASHTGCCEFDAVLCQTPWQGSAPVPGLNVVWWPFNLKFIISKVIMTMLYYFGQFLFLSSNKSGEFKPNS